MTVETDGARSRWLMREPGWYALGQLAAICRERDGLWHVYVQREQPPGDSSHITLREAKAHAARMLGATHTNHKEERA